MPSVHAKTNLSAVEKLRKNMEKAVQEDGISQNTLAKLIELHHQLTKKAFDTKRSALDGSPWAPLKQSTVNARRQNKGRTGAFGRYRYGATSILQRSKHLFTAATTAAAKVSGKGAEVTAELDLDNPEYAWVHQFGLHTQGENQRPNVYKQGNTLITHHVFFRQIPARPFFAFTEGQVTSEGAEKIKDILKTAVNDYVDEIFEGKEPVKAHGFNSEVGITILPGAPKKSRGMVRPTGSIKGGSHEVTFVKHMKHEGAKGTFGVSVHKRVGELDFSQLEHVGAFPREDITNFLSAGDLTKHFEKVLNKKSRPRLTGAQRHARSFKEKQNKRSKNTEAKEHVYPATHAEGRAHRYLNRQVTTRKGAQIQSAKYLKMSRESTTREGFGNKLEAYANRSERHRNRVRRAAEEGYNFVTNSTRSRGVLSEENYKRLTKSAGKRRFMSGGFGKRARNAAVSEGVHKAEVSAKPKKASAKVTPPKQQTTAKAQSKPKTVKPSKPKVTAAKKSTTINPEHATALRGQARTFESASRQFDSRAQKRQLELRKAVDSGQWSHEKRDRKQRVVSKLLERSRTYHELAKATVAPLAAEMKPASKVRTRKRSR